MSIQLATSIRDAMMNLIESDTGTSAIMKIRTGTQPANCAAADTGTTLATLNLPVDWMAAASAGAITKAGVWEDTAADASGSGTLHFRIYKSNGTTCQLQGTVTITGGGGDLTLNNTNIAVGQDVLITGFSLTAPGA